MSQYKAVFCDIDHTLTSPITRTIPDSARRALAQARKNGVKVFVATGRNLTAFEVKFLEGLTFDGYVTVNGQLCYLPDGTVLRKATFDPADVQASLALEERFSFHANYHEQYTTYLSGVNDGVEAFYSFFNGKLPSVRQLRDFNHKEILSIVPFVGQEIDDLFREKLPGCQVMRWNPLSCDIAPRSGGKDVGIRVMLEHFDLRLEDCIAIGDGGNDVSMIQAAGLGVAVGGALEEAKAAADYIAPQVDEGAIEHIFSKFGVI